MNENKQIKELLYGDKNYKDEEVVKSKVLNRNFYLKKDRSYSQRYRNEVTYESLKEKLYRQTTHCQYNIESLTKSISNIKSQDIEEEFMKEYKIKQFSDVIESLTAAVFLKAGLQGAQIFLRTLTILNHKLDYEDQFLSLTNELNKQLYDEYTTNSSIRKIEKILNYEFKYKKLLIIALTHSSYINKMGVKAKGLFNSYENLEFLGDAVHKFFIVKRLKEKFDKEMLNKPNKFESNNFWLMYLEDTEPMIEFLNKQKSAAENNELLGLIWIQSGIYEAILVSI